MQRARPFASANGLNINELQRESFWLRRQSHVAFEIKKDSHRSSQNMPANRHTWLIRRVSNDVDMPLGWMCRPAGFGLDICFQSEPIAVPSAFPGSFGRVAFGAGAAQAAFSISTGLQR